jgi:hypothetical protein
MPLHRIGRVAFAGVVLLLLLVSRPAWAQSTIAGRVTDTTGAVLPGVTVEASSPVLIEKVRTAVTDGQGLYSIVDVRPGLYTVTFSLPGFNTVRWEGVQVEANASVPINADMRVGAVEETITVTGQTPLVDVQQATQRQVLNREVLDTLPGNRTIQLAGVVLPGMRMSGASSGGAMVGGSGNTVIQQVLVTRGKTQTENTMWIDGMDMMMIRGDGRPPYDNFAGATEVAIETNPTTADTAGGGVKISMVPRDGGNTFAGDVHFSGMTHHWQTNNITDELRQKGLSTPTSTQWMYDLNPVYGGPIVRDRLWFFGGARINHAVLAPAGATYFENGRPGTRQGFNETYTDNATFRFTWQATQKNKITTYRDQFWRYQGHYNGTATTDWATVPEKYARGTQYVWPTKWTSTVTNRLLAEAGFQYWGYDNTIAVPQPGVLQERGTPEWYANASRMDVATGFVTRARQQDCCFRLIDPAYVATGSMSYVTGSHALKAGIQSKRGHHKLITQESNGALQQRYRSGVPDSVVVSAAPSYTDSVVNFDGGVFAQDQWTVKRLSVNAGLRVEHFRAGVGASSSPAGRFVPARSVDAFTVFDFTDVLPRFSAVYDLFGNAKTALKFSAGRYVGVLGGAIIDDLADPTRGYNPIGRVPDVRNWFDCDLTPGTSTCSGRALPTNGDDIAQDNEIAPSTNPLFGRRAAQRASPDLTRESSWDYSASLQQELVRGLSLSAVWYHVREGNLWANRDLLLGAGNFTPFQVANPLDNGEMITIYNLNRGTPTGDVVTASSDINRRTYNAFELSARARLHTGGTILGGWYTERQISVVCDSNNPNDLRFCDQSGTLYQELGRVPALPFRHELKLAVTHPLPWNFQGALSLISYSGRGGSTALPERVSCFSRRCWWQEVEWPVPANLFPGGRTVPVTAELIPPGTKYLKRWNQLDVSLKRRFRMTKAEILPSLDLYNLNNSSVVLTEVETFGPSLGRPTNTLPGRLIRLGVLVKF